MKIFQNEAYPKKWNKKQSKDPSKKEKVKEKEEEVKWKQILLNTTLCQAEC